MDQLLALFNRFSKLVKEAFNDDPRFLTARDKVSVVRVKRRFLLLSFSSLVSSSSQVKSSYTVFYEVCAKCSPTHHTAYPLILFTNAFSLDITFRHSRP